MQRRECLRLLAAAGAGALATLAPRARAQVARARVVVVGGGFAGATAAKYLRLFSGGAIDVRLVDPAPALISGPLSNLVLGGSRAISDLTQPLSSLATRHGVQLVRDQATAIDVEARRVHLATGGVLPYDRLVLAPGVDFMWDTLPALADLPGGQPNPARERLLHAWKAGPQTVALRRRLEALPDGGVFAMTIPALPFRCPPAPYERVCQIAEDFRRSKPAAKILVLDANPDIASEAAQFRQAWTERYPGIVEYRSLHTLVDVDLATNTLKFEVQDDVRADLLNVIPPMRAGDLAARAGLATANGRWCEVDFLSFASRVAPGVHVLGDAIQTASAMPKSAHMANQHGKVAAAAIVAMLAGDAPDGDPRYAHACYSFVSADEAMHIAGVHRYDAAQKTMVPVAGAGGVSAKPSRAEARHGLAWARNIWADTLG